MTNEEAIDYIEKWKTDYSVDAKDREVLSIAIQVLKQHLSKDMVEDFIKYKIDYLEDLASIETNEGRWREEEKYLYAISVLEEVVEYINTSGGGANGRK